MATTRRAEESLAKTRPMGRAVPPSGAAHGRWRWRRSIRMTPAGPTRRRRRSRVRTRGRLRAATEAVSRTDRRVRGVSEVRMFTAYVVVTLLAIAANTVSGMAMLARVRSIVPGITDAG